MTNPVAEKKQIPAFLVLTIISLIAALLLAGTNALTAGPIAERAARELQESFGKVLAADSYSEMTAPEGHAAIQSMAEAKDADGNVVGHVVKAAVDGYASTVAVTMGVDMDGKITGVVIGDGNFQETIANANKWRDESRAEAFVGMDVKTGGSIEAVSGATFTSKAVLNASNAAINAVNAARGNAEQDVISLGAAQAKPVEQMTLVGGIHEGSARGFASEVRVQLTMDDAGAVTGLAIDSSGETAGFGTRCMEEPEFAQQFVGKTAPFAIGGNIDALAGATVTSTAVVEAVNMAVAAEVNPDAVPFGQEADAPVEEPAAETSAEPLPEGALVGTAKGFQSEVKVVVTTDEAGAIASVTIDSSNETPGFGTRCGEDADFAAQFVGKTAPVEVDALAGATVTSKAVIDAVNSVFPTQDMSVTGEELPIAEAPAGTAYEGAAQGFQSEVKVTVYADEAGVITGVTIDSSNETPGFGTRCGEDADFAAQFVGKTAPVEVDALAGATVTSKAVVAAVNAALPAVEAPVEETPVETPAEEVAPAGTAYEGAAQGFQSEVKVTVYADEAGVITGVTIDSSNETPGFGTRCGEDADFAAQFVGKTAPVEVDALAGATVTSKAVVAAVNAALPAVEAPVEETPVETPAEEVAPAGTAYEGAAQGFQSEVKVTVYADEAGVITGVVIDSTGETAGFGTRCGEDADFAAQFVGKTAPVEVDVLAGATVTSKAVVAAVNAALPAVEAPVEETPAEAPAEEAAPAEETAEAVDPAAPGTLTVKAFADADVVVTVTLNEDGTVANLVVDASSQTPGLGKKCEKESFTSQFVGQAGPFVVGENIDAVSYATITSEAVANAVNELLGK